MSEETYNRPGTYICLHLTKESAENVAAYMEAYGVKCVAPSEMHTTLIYSRKPLEDFEKMLGAPVRFEVYNPYAETEDQGSPEDHLIRAEAKGWRVFDASWGGQCLVLELDCPVAVRMHKFLRSEWGATHNFPEYIPHLTVCIAWSGGQPTFAPPTFLIEYGEYEIRPIDENWRPKE